MPTAKLTTRWARLSGLTFILALIVACDDPKADVFADPAESPATPTPTPASPAPAPAPAAAAKAAKTTRPPLLDADFAESDNNRDPFRSFLAEFKGQARRTSPIELRVILPRYGLDELQLIAVVSGSVRPRAMFRDPTGLGVTVKRGDYISKSRGRIKQILPDKVVVQISETSEDQQTMADRVIELHGKEERESASLTR